MKKIILEKPKISLVYNKNKTLNLASIVKPSSETPKDENAPKSELPRIILDRVAIVEGIINYEDYTQKSKFDFSFHDIGFELRDIDTNDFNTSSANLRFYSTLGDGGFVDLKSEVLGFKPLIVQGSLDFEASKLYTQWRYLKDSLNLEVADGKIAFSTKYYVNLDDLNATTIDNLTLSLEGLRVKPKNAYKDVLNLDSLRVEDVTIKPMLQDVHVKNIALESLHIKAKRDLKGQIDWLEYIKSSSETVDENITISDENPVSEPWHVKVDDIALQKIKVDFYDRGVVPSVDTSVNELNLYLQNVTLAGEEPLLYQINMKLNDKLSCSSSGDIIHKELALNSYSKCSGLNLVHYRPYIDEAAKKALKVYDLNLKSAEVAFDANVSLSDEKEQIVVDVSEANLNLANFVLNKKSTKENLLNFSSFDVNSVSLNTKTKDVLVEKVALKGLDIRTKRLKDATLNVQDLVVPYSKKSVKKIKTKKEDEYKILLKHFALKSAKISFDDRVLIPSVKSKIDKIDFNAYNINSKEKSWLNYDFSLRVNGSGYTKAKGNLRHTPLKQKGSFELQRVSLRELTPYIQQSAFVAVDDGYLSLKSKINYAPSKKSPDLRVGGSLKLEEFFLSDSRDKTPLLSFSEVGLKSFTFEMFPNRLFIKEIDINSFYVNAVIDENKTMNLASLTKPTKEDEIVKKEDDNSSETAEKFPIKIMKLNVALGSANFADNSLPIKFQTNIHDLNGVVYAISNEEGETSFIDIVGEVDKYGSTKLKGSINSGNPKAYTDLDFSFRNLELNSVSGYSASFAGHEIDAGKLYLNLGYDIIDSELVGKNSIIIKNIELGKEFEDENITSLPLGFVIALLEDSDGIIDIDMPVEGNVDEPDFKYGALVWKTFGNLILKAVTSPFKFLGSMMGVDGEELEYVDFESGLANILPPEKEKLDIIAKMMIKRPKISLLLGGRYDEISDKKALQKEKLITLVVQKSGIKNREKHKSAMTTELLEEIYEELRDDKKIQKIRKKLKKEYKKEELERAYFSLLIKECINIQPLTIDELKTLGATRAAKLKSYLVEVKAVESSRVSVSEVVAVDEHDEKWVKTKLKVNVK